MPKEVTHWLIARQTAAALRGSPLGEPLEAFPNCLLLGAVVHDAPFYVRARLWKHVMSDFADALHGRGHDPFAVIGSLAQAAAQTRHAGPLRALLIGMLTHIAADSCFNPLVYHATGNYYDPDPVKRSIAVQLHRSFETALDVYLAGTRASVATYSLKHYIRCCEVQVSKILQEAFAPAAGDLTFPNLPDALLHCLRVFSRMQTMYAAPVPTRILELLYPLLPAGGREIAALFYLPRWVRQAPGLHGPKSFPDPEGRSVTYSILELYRRSIALSLELCREMEACLLGKQPFSPPRKRIAPDPHPQASPTCAPGA